ncbi:aminotransferase class III-fold pyridoxal phosphate-dependent enzyme [Actinocorallia populi]|uniref:aminotransferase class III-fold pyridoxal phosphate-dependent enzyme n=1 Tax=Actinocorallia populi TaxID=2079200 RepID=UPI000D08AC05|nr:aminotransferase class III-fold pyridoxal phosphate-dependent enzyme [Actinocorallia populi]
MSADPAAEFEALSRDQSLARERLVRMVEEKRPNMVLASTYVPPDGAVACYLLHRLLSRGDTTGVRWHSVFVNSGVEALGTVVKFLRNRANRLMGRTARIGVLDPTSTCRLAFVPGAADDGITLLPDGGEADGVDALIVVLDGLPRADAERAVTAARRSGAVVAVGVLRDAGALKRLTEDTLGADAVFLGESCVQGQIPCGTVSFTRAMFSLWNNPDDCVAHVSTFGGNALALELLTETLLGLRPPSRAEAGAITRMRRRPLVRRTRLRMHGNTWQTRAIDLAGINMGFDRADGVIYRSGKRRYIDLASGAGPAFRGHNRQSPQVVSEAGKGGGTEALEDMLAELTGLPVMLPAVSGASAVDLAVLAALRARPGRGTVVTLTGNYSGKGPLSLVLSRTSKHFRDRDADAFQPFPVRVVEVAADDVEALRRAVRRDDVALVWMEPVQGLDCVEIPAHVLAEVGRGRDERGYLVGFDEVLTGFWRARPEGFLAGGPLRPDIVALSKALSDALVPVGATMITQDVYDAVRSAAPETARWLRRHHRNDLGAALALAALMDERERDTAEVEAALADALEKASRSPVFGGYRRTGLLGRLVLSPRLVGENPDPRLVDHFEAVIARLLARKAGLITLQLRVLPCTAGPGDADLIDGLGRLGDFLERLTRPAVLRAMGETTLRSFAREAAVLLIRSRERLGDTLTWRVK